MNQNQLRDDTEPRSVDQQQACSGLDFTQGKSPVGVGLSNQQWTLGEWALQEGCFAKDRNNDSLRIWHEPTQREMWITERDVIVLAELLTRSLVCRDCPNASDQATASK